jgi:hypothetical protein
VKRFTDSPVKLPAFLAVLEIYFEAFAEDDPGRRRELLARCMTEDGEIWGPNLRFTGYDAILGEDRAFHRNWPGCRLVLASGLTPFADFARFWRRVRQHGSVVARGESIVESGRRWAHRHRRPRSGN